MTYRGSRTLGQHFRSLALAKVWNGPGWDKVGIEFTGSQQDPNFLPSLAPTNHPSVLVDISIFFDLKEIKEKL